METVFEADNNIEAHMIVHLLERSEIKAEIMGEHLQSGVGELPATGNIRVVVEPKDAIEARKIIAGWEADQPIDQSSTSKSPKKGAYSSLVGFLTGAGIASAFLLWAYNSPIDSESADYNRDGIPDEFYHWKGDLLSRVDGDRNSDGEIDIRYHYSQRLGVDSSESDDDFNGTFERQTRYKHSKFYIDDVDISGNGLPDYRYHYADGVLARTEMFDASTRVIRKTQYFENGLLKEARWDSDNDGVLDTVIEYGTFEEEVSRRPIAKTGN